VSGGRVVVVGDAFLDRDVDGDVRRVCPDSPAPVLDQASVTSRPGGAALAATLVPGDRDVTLVTATGADDVGRELAELIRARGVTLRAHELAGPTPEKIRLRADGHPLVRLDRGGPPAGLADPPGDTVDVLASASVILVSDYGRGLAAHPGLRSWLEGSGRPVVWDPHPRGPDPVAGCRVVTPNTSELTARFGPNRIEPYGSGPPQTPLAVLTTQVRRARAQWQAHAVVVTRGADGALLLTEDESPLVVPASRRFQGDTCGAGDCFAASVAGYLADGALPSEAVAAAVETASRFVAASAAGGLPAGALTWTPGDGAPTDREAAIRLAARVRREGGTVVATGGCFDLLHAGHLTLLRAARSLGDCLIVCLNSDRSVRRLKGPGRPVNPASDRAAVLASLGCVDAVCVFDEDTPAGLLDRLRPDLWAKGGDYDAGQLPESAVVASWGGQAVILPYLSGRSTTRILQRAALRR
jgi:rfaE bifunctional protein nucleotidyltransferase chain/domain/rfaE bifunctional protein kinase chain/domain